VLAVGHVGGREILYLVRNDMLSTHFGCFCAPAAGAGGRMGDQKSGFPIRQDSKLGKRCQLGCLRLEIAAGLVGLRFS